MSAGTLRKAGTTLLIGALLLEQGSFFAQAATYDLTLGSPGLGRPVSSRIVSTPFPMRLRDLAPVPRLDQSAVARAPVEANSARPAIPLFFRRLAWGIWSARSDARPQGALFDGGSPAADGGEGNVVVIAADRAEASGGFRRVYLTGRVSDVDGDLGPLTEWQPGKALPGLSRGRPAQVFLLPTRTYADGLSDALFSSLAPEDRRMIRKLRARSGKAPTVSKIALNETSLFETVPGYLKNEAERRRYAEERAATEKAPSLSPRNRWISFDASYLRNAWKVFKGSLTRPNRQDYAYLATKTFGVNLAVRGAFAFLGVHRGELGLGRALISTSYYQAQDALFTVFGQTYMKFLGRMTGMLQVFKAKLGDFLFVYFQLCFLEFFNRLVLGPIGGNPLVYTKAGIGLVFFNVLQGMASGGPLVPAINQMRKVGAISHARMMHLYQISSLTMLLGLFATFGYQRTYSIITGAILALSWGSYLVFSLLYKEPSIGLVGDPVRRARIDQAAIAALRASK